ncbi:MAG: hypothetical protein MK066_13120 [Crocinitomicaceae bacterium]|nr:hypothetical protein [Crocinitomicaceae bacterium]
MKKFITTTVGLMVALLLVSASCKNSRNADVPDTSNSSAMLTVSENMVRATVTTEYVKEGCEVLLKISVDGEEQLFMPISLEDEFKVDGLNVMVEYTLSRIMQKECLKGAPISVTKIMKAK